MNDEEATERAIQTQEAADAINAALADCSKGAQFFGVALFMAQWLYYTTEQADWEDQIDAFGGVVRSLLAVQDKSEEPLN